MGLAEKTYKKGEIIIKEGDVGKTLFYIQDILFWINSY